MTHTTRRTMILGALAICVMLPAPKGIWGFAKDRFGITLFPTSYHVNLDGQQVCMIMANQHKICAVTPSLGHQ